MNIAATEVSETVVAKTCGCNEKGKKVTYSFIDGYHSLCLDKKDVILAELEACERLLKYTADALDRKTIQTEVSQLKMILDLIS